MDCRFQCVMVGAFNYYRDGFNAGSVYLFDAHGFLLQTINNPTPADNDRFGHSIAITPNDNILVGAYGDKTGGNLKGTAYIFQGPSSL